MTALLRFLLIIFSVSASWSAPASARQVRNGAPEEPGSVRGFVLTATTDLWLANGYAGLRMDTTPVRIRATLWYTAPDRWRIDRSYLTPPRQRALMGTFLGTSVSLQDGSVYWIYDAVQHTATQRHLAAGESVFPSGAPLWFETAALQEPLPAGTSAGIVNLRTFLHAISSCDGARQVPITTPKVVGTATVAGRAAYVIDFGDRPCSWNSNSAYGAMGRRFIWVDQQTFFLLKVVRYSVFTHLASPHDRFFERTTVTHLQYSVPVAASHFVFTPPPGTRLGSAEPQPVVPATPKSLAAIRRQVSFPLVLPPRLPYGLRLGQAAVDGAQDVTLDYDASEKHLSILEGPLGCCLDADPRKYGGPTLPDGRTINLLDVGAQFGGRIVWWDQDGTYIALSGSALTTGDLLGIAASMADPGAVPPAARALAQRLGVQGTPVVGDQPDGSGGPWTIWLTRISKPQWVAPAGIPRHYLAPVGRALSVGPTGARGEFHYYNFTVLPPGSADPYHGPPVARARAIQVARQWLRRAGPSEPAGPLHVAVRRGMTVIGGTGLCCFNALTVLWWGGVTDQWGFIRNASAIIYVADAGTVVQADITPRRRTLDRALSTPCQAHPPRDSNGVALGPWCFDYAAAAEQMFIADVGGHSPWVTDPAQVAPGFAHGSTLAPSGPWGPWKTLVLSATQALVSVRYAGTSYHLTLRPAFPGLVGSIWELVRVERL